MFWLILGSTVFYSLWNPWYAWVPYYVILVAFYGGVRVAPGLEARKRNLAAFVVLLLIPLAFFKYLDFFTGSILNPVLGAGIEPLGLPLPLGISFVTFTGIAYLVDVYRGDAQPEPGLGNFTGFILFFPQLIAGPILRPRQLLPQLHNITDKLRPSMIEGVTYFTLGLVKKLVFADQLAGFVDVAFSGAPGLTGWDHLFGMLAFTIQIYCDFSGYTDMAMGAALLLGFSLPDNFERPYIAASPVDFWRRWHITLSTWIRDYLYIPLGGNRRGPARQYVNIMIAMTLCGLWHGANWTFMVWGAYHGLALAIAHFGARLPLRRLFTRARLNVAVTFAVVALGWVLFRAPGLAAAMEYYQGLVLAPYADGAAWFAANAYVVVLIAVFFALHPFDDKQRMARAAARLPVAVFSGAVTVLWLLSFVIGAERSYEFIYFDF